MSQPPTPSDGLRQAATLPGRIARAWRVLPSERRLAAAAAFGLFLTLFTPWYQETVIASGKTPALRSASVSLTGWGAFSFVEAAVLLVAIAVLVLLFVRAEGKAFHVPGGDGVVIMAAGIWTAVLIVWRMFDKEGTTGHGQYATTAGIEWGIFVALGVAALLAYAGTRIRRAHEPEPPLPGDRQADPGALDADQLWADRPARGERARTPGQPAPDRAAPREIRPHRRRVARESRSAGGLNFSDLDEIKFDDPPEPPTIRRVVRPDAPLEPPTIGRVARPDDPPPDPTAGSEPDPDEQPTAQLPRLD